MLDDLLDINEYFRYYDRPWKGHEDSYLSIIGKTPCEYGHDNPKTLNDVSDGIREYIQRWTRLLELPLQEEDGTKFRMVAKNLSENAVSYLTDGEDNPSADHLIYADNRAYVWTAAVLEEGGKSLQSAFRPNENTPLTACTYGHWIKLLNVDKSAGTGKEEDTHSKVSEFEIHWCKERSYRRWEESGIWYGYSYHSGAMLSSPWLNIEHFRHMYFDQALLLFYLRITLFRFSKELSDYATAQRSTTDSKHPNIKELRKQFSLFTMRYQFPLLSNQQQAVEMYSLARKHFNIGELYDEVKQEIDHTHDFVALLESKKLAKSANNLSRYGVPLATAGLVTSIFGLTSTQTGLIECISGTGYCEPMPEFWLLVLITTIFGGFAYFLVSRGNKEDE